MARGFVLTRIRWIIIHIWNMMMIDTDECLQLIRNKYKKISNNIRLSFLNLFKYMSSKQTMIILLLCPFCFVGIDGRRKLLPHDIINNILRTNNNPLRIIDSIVSYRWFVLFLLLGIVLESRLIYLVFSFCFSLSLR